MATKATPIRVGAIVNLRSNAGTGGYLDIQGGIAERTDITWSFENPDLRTFVFTHGSPNRSPGSGSWRIRSAQGDSDGTPLKVGDAIHLLSMHAGAGYLDSFEWVRNLAFFAGYPMTNGVFTASAARRGGGPTGTWTILADKGDTGDQQIYEGDAIYLRNGFPGAGFLRIYGLVAQNDTFKQSHPGQQTFVFTHSAPQWTGRSLVAVSPDDTRAFAWTISSSSLINTSYQVQLQWGDAGAPWHPAGALLLGERAGQPIDELLLSSTDQGKTLTGQVRYLGETSPLGITARQGSAGMYQVIFVPGSTTPEPPAPEEWWFGTRSELNLVAMAVRSSDGGRSLIGEVTFAGEGPVGFWGKRGVAPPDEMAALLQGRISKVEGLIDATYTLLSATFVEISQVALHSADDDAKLQAALATSNDAVDRAFQMRQVLNLYALSQRANSFLHETLQLLLQRSAQLHRLRRTLPPLHLYQACLQSIATDNELIQQATIQRRWNRHRDGQHSMSAQALNMLVIDKLAIKAVAPFQHLLSGAPCTVISYLSERTHIRRLPYAHEVVLVGVSYDRLPAAASLLSDELAEATSLSPAFELLAIPHEVGHYIYRHGVAANTTFRAVSEQFAANAYVHWCEEIFADLYGCVVAGPLSALGMHALLVSINKARAWKDDEEHPTPALRVFILAEILRVLGKLEASRGKSKQYALATMTDALDAAWSQTIAQWGYERLDAAGTGRPARVFLHDAATPQFDAIVNVERMLALLRPIIIEFATRLLNAALPETPQAQAALPITIPWSSGDYTLWSRYNDELLSLSNREFAGKQAVQQPLNKLSSLPTPPDEADPDALLQAYLDDWGDRGPTGSSGGTHGR